MQERFTKQGLKKLKKELRYLKNEKARKIAKQINYAASFGDLSENAAYHQAKEAKAFCVGRILELEKILTNAKVIESPKITVESEGKKHTFQIVGPKEADISQNKISYKSPLGSALCNKKPGDIVKIDSPSTNSGQAPAGGKIIYKILKVS